MKLSVPIKINKLIWMSLALAVLAGCASGVTKPKAASIDERVMGYWGEVLEGNYLAAYDYLSPGYRSSVDSNRYQRTMLLKKVRWEDAKIIESDCADITCKVKISLKYTVFSAVPGVSSFSSSQNIFESWVLADGIWYLVPER